jgi:hypothetical protein
MFWERPLAAIRRYVVIDIRGRSSLGILPLLHMDVRMPRAQDAQERPTTLVRPARRRPLPHHQFYRSWQ